MEKKSYIDRMQQGQRVDDLFLLKNIKLGETRAGKPYLVVTVMDKTGEISGPVWDNVDQVRGLCAAGDIVHLTGMVQSYRDQLQLRIDAVAAVDRKMVDPGSFYPSSPRDRAKMVEELQRLIRSVRNPYLKKLLQQFFNNSDCWALFQEAPAAKGIHHAYIGGLLEHSLSVARIADFLSAHYTGIDRCLLITGALLHDIGKLEELMLVKGLIDYTVAGRLKGHLVIGSEMVAREATMIPDFPGELLEQVQHLIVSHHGRQEFGSPTVPMTVEALILSFVDDLDAKLNITEQLRRKMDGREMVWSEYQRSLERFLYLSGLGAKELESGPENCIDPSSRQPSLF